MTNQKKNKKDGDGHEDGTENEITRGAEHRQEKKKRGEHIHNRTTTQDKETKPPTHRPRDTGQNETQTKTGKLELSLWQICPRRRIDPPP